MENIEILGFQFESAKALQPDPSSGKSWETCSSAHSEPSTTWCMCFNCSQMQLQRSTRVIMNQARKNISTTKRLYIYLFTILQILFMKLVNKHAISNLI